MALSPGVGRRKPPETVCHRVLRDLLSNNDAPTCELEATVSIGV
jgi:hypothetical protein